MINLSVEEYCQECPEFKPFAVQNISGFINKEIISCDTEVLCEHRERCAAMRKLINNRGM